MRGTHGFVKRYFCLLLAFITAFAFLAAGCSDYSPSIGNNINSFEKNTKKTASRTLTTENTAEDTTSKTAKPVGKAKTEADNKNNNNSAKPVNEAENDEFLEDLTLPELTTDDYTKIDDYIEKEKDSRLIKWYIDPNGNITTEGDKGVLGFGYSTDEYCFYATGNAWQRNFGYTAVYDAVSELIAISYDTIRIYFTYDNKEWMIQLWKGQYGFVLEGAEIGVYNRKKGAGIGSFYNCASNEDRLDISLIMKDKNKLRINRKPQTSWWMTGFVPGRLGLGAGVTSKYTKDLTVTTTITLKDATMRDAFVEGINNVSYIVNNVDYAYDISSGKRNPGERSYRFIQGSPEAVTVESGTFSTDKNSVTLTWR